MNLSKTIWRRLRSLGQRRVVKQEIDEELHFHIEQRTAENIAAGMSAVEAEREARKRFGNNRLMPESRVGWRSANLFHALDAKPVATVFDCTDTRSKQHRYLFVRPFAEELVVLRAPFVDFGLENPHTFFDSADSYRRDGPIQTSRQFCVRHRAEQCVLFCRPIPVPRMKRRNAQPQSSAAHKVAGPLQAAGQVAIFHCSQQLLFRQCPRLTSGSREGQLAIETALAHGDNRAPSASGNLFVAEFSQQGIFLRSPFAELGLKRADMQFPALLGNRTFIPAKVSGEIRVGRGAEQLQLFRSPMRGRAHKRGNAQLAPAEYHGLQRAAQFSRDFGIGFGAEQFQFVRGPGLLAQADDAKAQSHTALANRYCPALEFARQSCVRLGAQQTIFLGSPRTAASHCRQTEPPSHGSNNLKRTSGFARNFAVGAGAEHCLLFVRPVAGLRPGAKLDRGMSQAHRTHGDHRLAQLPRHRLVTKGSKQRKFLRFPAVPILVRRNAKTVPLQLHSRLRAVQHLGQLRIGHGSEQLNFLQSPLRRLWQTRFGICAAQPPGRMTKPEHARQFTVWNGVERRLAAGLARFVFVVFAGHAKTGGDPKRLSDSIPERTRFNP
jgi:hypothetical protein